MKLIVLAVVLALACGKDLRSSSIHGGPGDVIVQMINNFGYPATSTPVTTSDGYILQLIRIPGGRKDKHKQTQQGDWAQNDGSTQQDQGGQQRPVVLLMHGMMSSAEDFVYGGPEQALALYLADQGFDVFLGNARGSTYGRNHTTLNPTKDVAFWKFCWNEIGLYDLPALIDKVVSITNQNQLNFIGHMEGATAFLVMTSELPAYNDKIEKAVVLGPIAFMKKSSHSLLKQVVTNFKSKSWIIKNLGLSTFKPSSEIVSALGTECTNTKAQKNLCDNVYFLVNGFNSHQFNQTTVSSALPHVPSGGSVREVLHFAQLMETGQFAKFKTNPEGALEDYRLSQVTAKTVVYYAQNDVFVHPDDMQLLIQKLPNVILHKQFDDLTNNLDFLYAKDIRHVYARISGILYPLRDQRSREQE